MVRRKRKVSRKNLTWRRRQKKGAIMKRKTFKYIEKSAAARGYKHLKRVAGAAYWKTEKAKYRKSRRKRTTHHRYHRNRKGQFTSR